VVKTIWIGRVIGLVTVLALVGCAPSPPLPDDQPTLARMADSDDLEIALRATQKISEVYGEKALLDLLEKGGPNARGWAASLLLGHPSDRTRQALLVALKDSSPDVRSKALISLATLCDRTCLPAITPLANDPDPKVREIQVRTSQAIESRSP